MSGWRPAAFSERLVVFFWWSCALLEARVALFRFRSAITVLGWLFSPLGLGSISLHRQVNRRLPVCAPALRTEANVVVLVYNSLAFFCARHGPGRHTFHGRPRGILPGESPSLVACAGSEGFFNSGRGTLMAVFQSF